MKYWSFPANYAPARRRDELQHMVASGDYCFSEKWDGNWSRAILGTNHNILQTRGISKVTGTYGEVQDRVLWWEAANAAFSRPTVVIGEIYLDDGVDRDVGSILRCLPPKAIARQTNQQLKWKIFDVLMYDGEDIHELPLIERIRYIPYVVAAINHELVSGNRYYNVDKGFYAALDDILARGGEGVVMSRKDMQYAPGKRTARATCKIKKEVAADIDVVCIGTVPPTRDYGGKQVEDWVYWENLKTGEKERGNHYRDYITNHAYEPITKNYFYGWPGAISCGVYNAKGELVHVCDVAGLDEDLKSRLAANRQEFIGRPLKVSAMEVTPDGSLRHPRFLGFRDDIAASDCTLSKILEEL